MRILAGQPRGGISLLWVKNNGLKLSKFQRSKIFEMLKRLETHVEATEIGLHNIEKNRKHLWKDKLESEFGKETAF